MPAMGRDLTLGCSARSGEPVHSTARQNAYGRFMETSIPSKRSAVADPFNANSGITYTLSPTHENVDPGLAD